MKLNKFFMLGLAGLAFAACSNDDEVPPMTDNTEGKVRVTLSLGRTVGTRSLGVTADNQYNLIKTLQFVFYDGSNRYVAYPSTGTLNGESYDNQAAINQAVTDLKNSHSTTVELKDIPGSAKQLLIIANNKTEGDIDTGSLQQTQASIIHLSEQNKNDFKVFSGEESTLSGLAQSFTQQKVADKVVYNASVELRPVPSRIEVGNITAQLVPESAGYTGADISKFQVLGYYINNFYTTGALSAQLEQSQRQKVDNGSDVTKYTQDAYTKNTNGNFSFMCDEPTEGQIEYAAGEAPNIWQGTTAKNEQQANQYWGYQILKGDVPHIVIKLSVDYAEKGDIPEQKNVVKFLTISGYKYGGAFTEPFDADKDGNTSIQAGAPVKYMHRGHVYKVENIVFNANDLTEAPYEETKNIQATVTVLPWKGVPVTPEFQ